MKIVKIISDKKYVSKTNGKEYKRVNYYVQLDNAKLVAIRPSFKQGYTYLDAIAVTLKNHEVNTDDTESETETDELPF